MKGIKGIVVTLIAVGIFAFAFVTFGIQVGLDNNANQSIASDPAITAFNDSLFSQLSSYKDDVNSSDTSFSRSEPTTGSEGLQIFSVANIWKTLVTVPYTVYRLSLGLIVDKIFSDPAFSIIFTLLSSLVVVVILLYSWQWIRSGTPG